MMVSSPKAVPVGLRVKARYFEVGKESDHERETLHRIADRFCLTARRCRLAGDRYQ